VALHGAPSLFTGGNSSRLHHPYASLILLQQPLLHSWLFLVSWLFFFILDCSWFLGCSSSFLIVLGNLLLAFGFYFHLEIKFPFPSKYLLLGLELEVHKVFSTSLLLHVDKFFLLLLHC